MKTKIPFASRCLLLCVIVTAVSSTLAWQLVQLQVVDPHGRSSIAESELIEHEKLPAQRGIVMDRNEEILTNNIQSAELEADRYHLREVTVVVDGLAYNQAIHDPRWKEAGDEKARYKLIRNHRSKLLRNAAARFTPEEKAELARQQDPADAQAKRLLEYDPEVCAYYYSLHDKLVADVLYPFLSKVEIEEKDAGGSTRKRFMTREDIIARIAQPEIEAHNREAEAKGEKPRKFRNKIVLAKGLPLDTAEKIRTALAQAHVRGIVVQEDLRRSYVMPEMLCHVLGYVNHENKGMSGVENQFQSHLAGIDGMREYRHGSRGQVLPNEDDRYLAPKDGLNLRLTIDMRLQTIVEQELDRGLRHFRAPRGCMIVVEPKTGDILAMVSRPSFDLNTKEVITPSGKKERGSVKNSEGNVENGEYNFACQARYEPGSTFKVVAVTAAVDTKLMGINSWIPCAPFSVGGGSKPINDGRFNYGTLPMWGVLKKSSNPGSARIAIACKWPLYRDYLQRYGLHQSAGIDLPSGGGCSVADGNNIVNFSRIAYGYSVSVSPLHMAMVYATIANNGLRMKPRLIDRIISADGSVYDECKPQEVQRVMSEKTAADLRFALETVTDLKGRGNEGRGTASRARIPGFRVGGKTGTAKKTKRTGGYYDGLYTVSFAGVFPIDDPKLVVMTVIDEPHPTDCNPGGGTVAAPIFRAAVERMIDVLNIAPSDPAAYEAYLTKIKEEGRPENPYQTVLTP